MSGMRGNSAMIGHGRRGRHDGYGWCDAWWCGCGDFSRKPAIQCWYKPDTMNPRRPFTRATSYSCDVCHHSTPHLEEVCCCQVAPDIQSRLVIAPATVSCLEAADRSGVVGRHVTRLEERLFHHKTFGTNKYTLKHFRPCAPIWNWKTNLM